MEAYLRSFNILEEKQIENVIRSSSKRILNRSDLFIREGQICKEVAFVVSGTLRSFYISDKGEEITYCITFPNNLMTAYSSFITEQPTPENIQAVTPVELLVIPKQVITDMEHKHTDWVRFLKIVAEQQYVELEKRVFQLQKSNAKKKYLTLLHDQPDYIQKIPLQYLASYLGITQRHLSRIRKEISI